jgi:hypothetical protein
VIALAALLAACAQASAPAKGHGAVSSDARQAGPRVVAQGRTAAGTPYSISTEADPECATVMVTFAETSFEPGASNSECLDAGEHSLSLSCRRAQRVAIAAIVPADVRKMRLRLADNRRIVSPVARVRARVNDTFGVYYQALRASMPRPVSLTALDARGRVLRVRPLHDDRSCLRRSRGGETIESNAWTGP